MKLFEGTLILTDLDGTYLFDDHHISKENRDAARYFMDNGGLFTVATGRSKAGMEHFFPELEINAPAILYNGSVIYDFERKADVLDTCVGQEGFALCKALETNFSDIGIEVYADHTPFVAQDHYRTRRHFQNVKTHAILPLFNSNTDAQVGIGHALVMGCIVLRGNIVAPAVSQSLNHSLRRGILGFPHIRLTDKLPIDNILKLCQLSRTV